MAGMLEADIHPARVLACDSSGHLYNVARAIRWAAGEDVGAGILNAARLQEEVAGLLGRDEPSLHHAMSVRTDGDGDSPFWSHVDEKRLCSLYEFDANERAETGVDYYSIFRVPQGEALTMDNAEHVQSGESVRFVLSNPETAGYDFGLQFCSNENGENCRSSELIPLQTARLQAPARCR